MLAGDVYNKGCVRIIGSLGLDWCLLDWCWPIWK